MPSALFPLLAILLVPAVVDAARVRFHRPARSCEVNGRRLATFEQRSLAACGEASGCTERAQRRHARYVATANERCVTLNEVQVLGSHNSYHIQPQDPIWSALLDFDPVSFLVWEYTHLPLDQQFATQGIRQIELDLPGTKVLHVQDLDFETTCLTFVDCLQVVKSWSDANPGHLPLMILVEAKDDVLGGILSMPIPWSAALFDTLDADIRSVFPPDRLITPDDVRAGEATLEQAVLTKGWPTLGWSRGKVLFALDNGGAKRTAYQQGHPSLEGRILFTDAPPGQPEAAFVKANNPLGPPAFIPGLVEAGYIVRTRADADTVEARTGDTVPRDAALASGAQYVSSDYPVPNPDFGPARCNPINGPAWCRSFALESLP
jgi:hypothetical protein